MYNVVDDSMKEDLRKVDVPLILAYGGSDGFVSLDENVEHLNEIFPKGIPANISLLLDRDADHYLTFYNKLDNAYQTIEDRERSQLLYNGYVTWLEENVF